jgi:hypothetical protein
LELLGQFLAWFLLQGGSPGKHPAACLHDILKKFERIDEAEFSHGTISYFDSAGPENLVTPPAFARHARMS